VSFAFLFGSRSLTRLSRDHWKVWKNGAGVTATIRRHLIQNHSEIYNKVSKIANLKHASSDSHTNPSSTKEPFTVEGWLSRLMKRVVVDDQVQFYFLFALSLANRYFHSPSMLLTVKNFGNLLYMVVIMCLKVTSLTEQNLLKRYSQNTNLSVKSYLMIYR
jgi:hypothetical protein